MTPRERVLDVLRGQMPDRVPVMPGYGSWYVSRVLGGDLFDIEEGRISEARAMADITRKYGCEVWYWQGYVDDISQTGSDGRGVHSEIRQQIDSDSYTSTVIISTEQGQVSESFRHSRYNPPAQTSGFIKDPGRDWPVYKAFSGEYRNWSSETQLALVPKDDLDLGITSFVLLLPVDFWKNMRCDTGGAITDMCDGNPYMEEAMDWHMRFSCDKLAARLRVSPLPDMIHLQGSSSSLSVISPGLYRRYNLGFITAVCDMAHAKNVPVQIHHCGRSAALVDILCEETEVDAIHPLESAPGGDVDLRSVKRRFGNRIVLMGNLNTYQLMLFATPEEIKQAARQCIEDAAEGGRFILTTGDQLGRETPEENVMAMVEAAYDWGQY